MIKASALYIVIIISLVIALLCSSLVTVAYFYRLQVQKADRYNRLLNNVNSGVNIILTNSDTGFFSEQKITLSESDEDSVLIKKNHWGIFDVGVSRAFIQNDTLTKVFSIANIVDSTKWCVLYIPDNKSDLVVSGKTMIRGKAFIPKAGVKAASVNGNFYDGDDRLIIGSINYSNLSLPPLSAEKLNDLEAIMKQVATGDTLLMRMDSVSNSFLQPTRIFNFGKNLCHLRNIKIAGNIIIRSDTLLTIDSTAKLDNVIIIAKSISVSEGFVGRCQLFGADTIGIMQNCRFNYPSCIGVLRFFPSSLKISQQIDIGDNVIVNGSIFTYEAVTNNLLPAIKFGRNSKVYGQVYVPGLLNFGDGMEIDGSTFANIFLYKSPTTTYSNNLVNIKLDEKSLSPYYLTSSLMPVSNTKKKILEWIKEN
jgi:hypothetical protein